MALTSYTLPADRPDCSPTGDNVINSAENIDKKRGPNMARQKVMIFYQEPGKLVSGSQDDGMLLTERHVSIMQSSTNPSLSR